MASEEWEERQQGTDAEWEERQQLRAEKIRAEKIEAIDKTIEMISIGAVSGNAFANLFCSCPS